MWLGPTPIDHPLRRRDAGTFDAGTDHPGWPDDASGWVLGEAHPALRVERIDPEQVLVLEGIVAGQTRAEVRIPPYRIAVTTAWRDTEFRAEPARIHTLCVVPGAGMGAAIWRSAIDLDPSDAFGRAVGAVIVGVEDASAPPHDTEHWSQIAIERWLEPERALDDRPLLPASLAETSPPAFAPPSGDDPARTRHEAADAWARRQTGAPKDNPFAQGAGAGAGALGAAEHADAGGEGPPSSDAMEGAADAALALGRERHRAAGFDPDAHPGPAAPRARGATLEAEIEARLSGPHRSPMEVQLANSLGPEQDAALERMAAARALSPMPVLGWDPMPEPEAERLGGAFVTALVERPAFAWLDVSSARIGGAWARGTDAIVLDNESFERLLAEQTRFEGVEFIDCDFTDATLCAAEFQHCTFTRCRFVRTNLNRCAFAHCTFVDSNWCDLRLAGPTWGETRFERCEWSGVQANDVAATDLVFEGGTFDDVQICDALWIRVAMRAMRWKSVALLDTHAPECTLEDIEMEQTWITTKGFSASRLTRVRADTCGFLSMARFDATRIEASRFRRCGFNKAVLKETVIDAASRFVECDFTGAVLERARIDGARFAQCAFSESEWTDVSAIESWFLACAMTGVDLGTVHLTRAVFTDSNLDIVHIDPARSAGADFRGTGHRQ